MKYFNIKYLWKTFLLNLLNLPIFAQSKSNNFDEFCSNTIVPHKNTIDLNSKIDLREKYNHILRQWNSSLIQYQEVLKFYESEKFKGNQTNLSYLFSKMQNCTNLLDDLRLISIYIANQSHSLKQNTIRPQFNLSSEATTSPTTSTVEFFYPYSGVYLLSIITSIFIISIGGIIYWKYKKEKPVLNELHQIDNEDLEPNAVTLLKQSVPFLSPTVNNSLYDTPKFGMYTGTGVLRTFPEQSNIPPQPFESTVNSINSDSNEYRLIESLQRSNSH